MSTLATVGTHATRTPRRGAVRRRTGGALAMAGLVLSLAAPVGATTTPLAPFASTVHGVSAAQLGKTWHEGCPVGPTDLRLVTMSYVGFDGASHTGTMVVNRSVTSAVTRVFAFLYSRRFPLHSMIPESRFRGHDPASMAADNTSGFNCRYAVASGAPQWSVHAYGEAIDVNPVQNPYVFNGVAQPVAGRAYVNRADVRPGMAEVGGSLVNAFKSVGWFWGGRWGSSPDYQHFSLTGG